MNNYTTEFNDYKDLPFSMEINNELFLRHEHGILRTCESVEGEILYKEKDVLILLQKLQNEFKNK